MPEIDPLIVELTQVRERRGPGIRETARLIGIGHMPGKVSEWAPFAALWALRAVDGLDEELVDWRSWIEEDYFDGETVDLPPLAGTAVGQTGRSET